MAKKSTRGRNKKQSKQSAHNGNGSQSKRSPGTGKYIFDGLVAMVRPMVNTEKEWGVERMTELANAAQEYATSLEDTPNLAGYAKKAAESLREFADYVNENEFDQILKDSTEYAKRNPIPIIVGGALAGLVVTLMLRSNGSSVIRGRAGKTSNSSRRAKTGNARANGRSSGEAIRLNA
jgi:sugar/nucleoside kinase (ribokinase family)